MNTKPKKVNTTGLPPVKRFLYSLVAESVVLVDGLSGARFLNLKTIQILKFQKKIKKYLAVDNFMHYDCIN
jgi:hypothetical protein